MCMKHQMNLKAEFGQGMATSGLANLYRQTSLQSILY